MLASPTGDGAEAVGDEPRVERPSQPRAGAQWIRSWQQVPCNVGLAAEPQRRSAPLKAVAASRALESRWRQRRGSDVGGVLCRAPEWTGSEEVLPSLKQTEGSSATAGRKRVMEHRVPRGCQNADGGRVSRRARPKRKAESWTEHRQFGLRLGSSSSVNYREERESEGSESERAYGAMEVITSERGRRTSGEVKRAKAVEEGKERQRAG
ncbi:uncharacterized protein A4U43_C01F34440 [Asparagus officinalis]|uniref:Uncharacterized protein n=1 Tax=Asparagus officinalis TaxID=4686 RepID=A0A5P1FUD6_ASPOF|nr:uncharacterized protein A4U43_C01F34440 [Asparagus officinalis]